jgi:hypothetical protein
LQECMDNMKILPNGYGYKKWKIYEIQYIFIRWHV